MSKSWKKVKGKHKSRANATKKTIEYKEPKELKTERNDFDNEQNVLYGVYRKVKSSIKNNPKVSIIALIIIIILILEIISVVNKKPKVEETLKISETISTDATDDTKELIEETTTSQSAADDTTKENEVIVEESSERELKSETTIVKSETQAQNENKGYTVVPRLEDSNPMTLVPDWKSTDMVTRDQIVHSYLSALYSYELASPYQNFDFGSYNIGRKGTLIFLNDLVICGDSYCGFLSNYLKNNTNYANGVYAHAGQTIIENKDIYERAIDSPQRIVMLSTSVNDVLRGTDLKLFKETMEGFFRRAYEKNKIMIVHSYCNFIDEYGVHANDNTSFNYTPKDYDEILRRSASKYGNVVYVNCTDIARDEYLRDTLHYNDEFYRQLLDRVESALLSKIG